MLQSRNLHHRYIYQNYAYISQDVFGGYGPKEKEKLLAVERNYDPERVFEKLQPGYFKLRKQDRYIQGMIGEMEIGTR